MLKIACILPDRALATQAESAFQEIDWNIFIDIGLLDEGVNTASRLIRQGFEIIISRGRTAAMIREAHPDISVVEIPTTVLDVLQSIEKAKIHGNIAVVAFTPMILGLEHFQSMFKPP